MNVLQPDAAASSIAAAIGEPSRARMLYSLVDGRARTTTELAATADVTAATASVHLHRLRTQGLVRVFEQGKHRYYTLAGTEVAAALESLSVLAGGDWQAFVSHTPPRLRHARSCYDHLAGTLGVLLHDRMKKARWLAGSGDSTDYGVTATGGGNFAAMGIDVEATRGLRRRFAFACLDWSERRPHLGGGLGAALLTALLQRRWVTRELESRVLAITPVGRRELSRRFDLDANAVDVHPSVAHEAASRTSQRA